MPSNLDLACSDLAALLHRGLGDRVSGIRCHIADSGISFTLERLEMSNWLPRVDLEIAVTATLVSERQELSLIWKVVPSSLVGIIAVPIQHFGAGSKVIDAIIDRLGWSAAVISRDDKSMVLGLRGVPQLRQLGVRLQSLTVTDLVRLELSLEPVESSS